MTNWQRKTESTARLARHQRTTNGCLAATLRCWDYRNVKDFGILRGPTNLAELDNSDGTSKNTAVILPSAKQGATSDKHQHGIPVYFDQKFFIRGLSFGQEFYQVSRSVSQPQNWTGRYGLFCHLTRPLRLFSIAMAYHDTLWWLRWWKRSTEGVVEFAYSNYTETHESRQIFGTIPCGSQQNHFQCANKIFEASRLKRIWIKWKMIEKWNTESI